MKQEKKIRKLEYLRQMSISPVNSMLDGLAHITEGDGPIVLQRVKTTAEEIFILGWNNQRHWTTWKNVLQAHRPSKPFSIDFIPAHCTNHMVSSAQLNNKTDMSLSLFPHYLKNIMCFDSWIWFSSNHYEQQGSFWL